MFSVAELEQVVLRKNYKFNIDWNCQQCGKRTDMLGCVLPGEKFYEDRKSPLTWDDILHKHCKACNLTTRPLITCNKCDIVYPLGTVGCDKCDLELEKVIDTQASIQVLKNQIKKHKRKGINYADLESNVFTLISNLNDMGYKQCEICDEEFVLDGLTCCFQCNLN